MILSNFENTNISNDFYSVLDETINREFYSASKIKRARK